MSRVQRLKHVLNIDVETCRAFGRAKKVTTSIEDPQVITITSGALRFT